MSEKWYYISGESRVVNNDSETIAEIYYNKSSYNDDEAIEIGDKHGRLMAAAPEMLASLERVLACLDPLNKGFDQDSLTEIISEMVQVIRKAKSKSD